MEPPKYRSIRIVIADDHELLREGFRTMLKKQDEFCIVGEAADGKELIEQAAIHQPDIIFTDIHMPGMNGIEATRVLTKNFPSIGVIALTIADEDNQIIDMLEAGAKGYMVKNASKQEIEEAIHTVYERNNYYCRHTSSKLARLIASSRFYPNKINSKPVFSEKETQVIILICQGLSNKEIADKMQLSRRTVEGYRERILEKMEVHNMAGIAVYAIRHGIYKV